MSDNVIPFNGITKNDIDAEAMLRTIASDKPANAFVIVWPSDGSMPTYHSSAADMLVVMYRVQEFIHKQYSGDFQ